MQHNEIPSENQNCNIDKLKVYEELEKEEELLFREKNDLSGDVTRAHVPSNDRDPCPWELKSLSSKKKRDAGRF